MEQKRIIKKLISSLMLIIIILSQFSAYRFESIAKSEVITSGESLFLAESRVEVDENNNDNAWGYAISSSATPIFKIISYDDISGTNSKYSSNLYCIKAGYGETWQGDLISTKVKYDTHYNFASNPSTISNVVNDIISGDYYNEILWIIDHMYVPGDYNNSKQSKQYFLESIGLEYDEENGYYVYMPTNGLDYTNLSTTEYTIELKDEDIIAIQQAAIWYYTNYKKDGNYDKKANTMWLKYTTLNSTDPNDYTNAYQELAQYINGTEYEGLMRNEQAIILYNYLIDAAAKETENIEGTYQLKNTTVKLWLSSEKKEQPIIEVHKKAKTGNYNLILIKEDENGEQLNSEATFEVNEKTETVTGTLVIADDVEITKENLNTQDKYTIKETVPPDEYCKFDGIITVTITKKETENGYEADEPQYEVTDKDGNDIKEQTGKDVNVYLKDGNIYVEVKNYPEPKPFDLALRKAIVSVQDNKGNNKSILNEDGKDAKRIKNVDTSTLDNEDDDTKTDTATYNHRKDPIVVEKGDVVKYLITIYNEGEEDGYATKIVDQLPGTEASGLKLIAEGKVTSSTGNEYKIDYDNSLNKVTLTLISENKKEIPAYDGTTLSSETILLECEVTANADSINNKILTNIAYIAEEYNVATQETIINTGDRDSQPENYPTFSGEKDEKQDGITYGNDLGYTGNSSNDTDLSKNGYYYKGKQDDDDFEKIVILPKAFDLKLIKFITQVNEENTENRVLNVDLSKINTIDPITGRKITTGDYKLEKNPVAVEPGDFVTYTFRIYNEGDYDGYAKEISEDIPEGLEFIVITEDKIYSWDGKEQNDITEEMQDEKMLEKIKDINSNWGYNKDTSIITTKALENDLIKAYGIEGYDKYADTKNKIDYKEISVIFRVKDNISSNVIIRNEAAITEDKAIDNQGNEVDIKDRDSSPDEWNKKPDEQNPKYYDENKKWPIYKEDDEDYDNIITKSFDLSLRKQIVKINDKLYTNRYANLSNNEKDTIYNYYDVESNKPSVKAGDIVTYSIRVYNEGEIDGYAKLIADTLPSGLEFYSSVYNGVDYGWKLVEGTTDTYQTDYLSYEKDANKGTEKSNLLKAYTGTGEADFKEIFIVCKVKSNVTKNDSLLNVAQIADDSDSEGKIIKDKDSIPGTTDRENKWKNEDDLDIENLQLKEFDLALRKFITEIETTEETKEVTSRIPEVSYDEETSKLVYEHSKDPLIVHVGDTVIYTLRVYNEGEIAGYADEIKDDIPEYLEYLPEHKINTEYKWAMYDKEGKETEDVTKAVCIRTRYLSQDNETTKGEFLLKEFDVSSQISDSNPDYLDVKVAFKVKDPNSSEYIITNFAQISEDTDSEGNPVDDIDSTPDNGEGTPKEDDEDIEKVKVQYFDLSLLKYVTKVHVNENGKQSIIETGNIGDENDKVPVVSLNKKNIYKSEVKFEYIIKITNEGDIAGYAKEITDYIPEGLEFVANDNPTWKDEGNRVISTRALENTLLQPGESAEVTVILKWINGENNLDSKINIAEISEDYNNENVPDRDSTPDNQKPGEDDIDEAEVLLEVDLGGGINTIYLKLILTLLAIILVGLVLIKKFVL